MRHRFLFSHLPLLLVCGSSLFAQNSYNFSQFRNETWGFIKQPTQWEGSDWLKVGLIGAGTFLVMQADQPISDAARRDQRHAESVPLEFGKMWGESYMSPILAGAFGLHGVLKSELGYKRGGRSGSGRLPTSRPSSTEPIRVGGS